MLRNRVFAAVVLCCHSCIAASRVSWAQTETATISGRISDSTGAIVVGATIELQNIERGASTKTATNSAGIYLFPSVQAGLYRLAVQKDGFKSVDLLNLVVNVQDHIEQNFSLQLGSVLESITVTGHAPLVNTEDASVSTVVDRNFVEKLPLNGR